MNDIPYYNTFEKIELINKGMSGDRKYYIQTKDGAKRLLRVSDISVYEQKKSEFEAMKQLVQLDIPMSQPIDFGICDNGKSVYSLLSWIEGDEVEEKLPNMTEAMQYKLGIESGKILHKIHTCPAPNDVAEWSKRYLTVINERLQAFMKEGVPFEGDKIILNYLEENKYLLLNRPQCHQHGDFHMGNLIVSPDEQLYVIDWHMVDFENYGDPWYEFNRLGIEFPAFASGQIDGYFNSRPPEGFWKLLSYYLVASAITSIVWSKYFAPERLDSIIKLNKDILAWTDNLKNPIPSWYVNHF